MFKLLFVLSIMAGIAPDLHAKSHYAYPLVGVKSEVAMDHPSFVPTADSVLFLDTFDTPLSLQMWSIHDHQVPRSGPSNWVVESGRLRQKSNIWGYDPPREFEDHMGTLVLTGEEEWTDYTFNTILRSSDNDGIGLIVRAQDENNYYRILLMNDAANSGDANSPIQRIQKIENGLVTTLAEIKTSEAYPPGYFALTIDVRGAEMTVYLDGEELLFAKDETFESGKIGLLTYANTGAYFDNVQVSYDMTVFEAPNIEIVYPVLQERDPYIQRPTQTSVGIAWRTLLDTKGSIHLGDEKGNYTKVQTESVSKKKHYLEIDGLEPDTRYYYVVRNNGEDMVEERSFVTAPDHDKEESSFFILGDSGTGNDNQRAVAQRMKALHGAKAVDFLLHVGDVHQGDGSSYDDIYFDIYQPLLGEINFYLSVGNHDTYTDNSAPYLDDFYLPNNNADQTERYYSFRWGNAFFIALDSNIPMQKGSKQYDFLVEQLQSEEASTATWKFAFFHHPPYSEFWPAWAGDPTVREDWLPLFEQYKVDVVFNGHTHSYEYGILNDVRYVVTGGGGGGLDTFGRDFDHVLYSVASFHVSRVDIQGNRLEFEAIDPDGQTVHSWFIQKNLTTSTVTKSHRTQTSAPVKVSNIYPNPSNPDFTIEYDLADTMYLNIELVNTQGQRVDHLFSGFQQQGRQRLNVSKPTLASGTYFVRFLHQSNQYTFPVTLVN